MNNTIDILHLKIRSLKFRYDELLILLAFLEKKNLIALTETWFSELDDPKHFTIADYNEPYVKNRPKTGRGLAIYVAKGFEFKKLEVTSEDIIGIEITTERGACKNLFCFYSPADRKKEILLDNIEYVLCSRASIFVGNSNIDIIKDKTITEQYKSFLVSFGSISTQKLWF